MKIIDLSHKIDGKTDVYPGDSKAEFVQTVKFEEDGYNKFVVRTAMHVGTHIDAPLHMVKNGKMICDFEAEKFIGNGVLIDARGKKEIGVELVKGMKIPKGSIVLIFTGFYRKFGKPEYFAGYPEITEEFATRMVELGVKIVGTDTASPDGEPFKIHRILLGREVLILENLTNLEELAGKKFEVYAVPPKIAADASLVRVFASQYESYLRE